MSLNVEVKKPKWLNAHTGYIFVIVLLIAGLFIQRGCNKKRQNRMVDEIVNYKTDAKHYKDKYDNEIATNSALLLSTQSQIKSLVASNDTLASLVKSFSEVQSVTVVKETITIKEVPVPFDREIPCDFQPFQISKIDSSYRFYSTISNKDLTIDSLMIPNTVSVVVGEKKKNFFAPKKMTVDVMNSNPLVSVSNVSNYTYQPKKKWYEKWWVHEIIGGGIGAAIGYGAATGASK